MAANINDKITSASSGVRPVNTTVSNIRNSGNTTLSCADLTGWPTASAVHFVTYKLDGTGNIVVGTQSDWKGIVSGSDIINLTLTGGSDNGNAIGDIVVCLPTARYGKELYDALSLGHEKDGSHKAFTESNIIPTAALQDSSITTAKINDGAVTNAKLAANTAWTSWTPTYTNITVGNGTVVSKYQQIGKTVTWHWRIVCGTTTSIGPNTAKISLPVNASSAYAASGVYLPIGYVVAIDIGVGGYYGLMNLNNSSTEVEFDYSSGVNITGTFPFTEVSGDTVSFTVTYEAA